MSFVKLNIKQRSDYKLLDADLMRELVALLGLSSWCLVMVELLFLAVLWGCLLFVIVVFPDHTHNFRNNPENFHPCSPFITSRYNTDLDIISSSCGSQIFCTLNFTKEL